MKNLAGVEECDAMIERELIRCGIEVVKGERTKNEVPFSVTGKLGNFTFHRAWYYYVVKGDVPLRVAQELYADPVGKTDVRVAGHCACPPPQEWAFPSDENILTAGYGPKKKDGSEWLIGRDAISELDHSTSLSYSKLAQLCDEGKIPGERYVDTYHIDSEIGLRFFADTIKKYGLASISHPAPQEEERKI